jgi:hypothetical protein
VKKPITASAALSVPITRPPNRRHAQLGDHTFGCLYVAEEEVFSRGTFRREACRCNYAPQGVRGRLDVDREGAVGTDRNQCRLRIALAFPNSPYDG